MMDSWEETRHAARPPRLWGRPHRSSRPAALPPPRRPPPLVACRRDERGSGVRRRAEAEAACRWREGGGGRAEGEEAAAAAAAAGGNAVAHAGGFVGGSAERFAAGMVALEERGSGGGGEFGRKRGLARPPPNWSERAVWLVAREDRGSGGGSEAWRKRGLAPAARPPPKRRAAREDRGSGGGDEFGWKRGLAPAARPPPKRSAACLPARGDMGSGGGGEFRRKRELALAARPPPKRMAASATRGFPAVGRRDAVAPILRAGGENGLRVSAAPSRGGFSTLVKAARAPPSGISGDRQDGLLLEAAAANAGFGMLGKVVRADGDGNAVAIADGFPENRAEGFPGLVLERGRGASTGELGKEWVPAPRLSLNWKMVCAKPCFPSGRGRDVVGSLASGGGGEVGLQLESRRADGGLNVLEKMIATSHSGSAVQQCAMGIGEGMNKDALDGPVKGQELEGKVAAKGDGQELKEADIARQSDHIVQEPRVAVEVIPHDPTASIMRSKIRPKPRKTVCPPVKENHKSLLVTLDRPFSTITDSFATSKKSKTAQSKHLPVNDASTSALGSKEKRSFKFLFISKEKLKDKVASHLEDDDILKALAVHDGKLELYLNVPSCVPSTWCQEQDGGQNADARSKVRMMCRRFQFLCRFLVQAVKQRLLEVPRVDLAADKVIKQLPGFTKHRPIVSKVPGVEVGDIFLFRVELAIVGLHSPYRGGIGTTKDVNGVPIAISIVASGGYRDEWSSSSELIYTGSGGKAAGNEQDGDQKLQCGNLALENCIKTKTPVRVIHGFKRQNREEESHSNGKVISKFTYDGLYLVVECWREGHPGSKVFKYKLQIIPGQPEVPLHVAKRLRKSAVQPGLSVADVSRQKARIPIRVISNADNVRPDSRRPGER